MKQKLLIIIPTVIIISIGIIYIFINKKDNVDESSSYYEFSSIENNSSYNNEEIIEINKRIKMTINEHEIFVLLNDSQASQSFIDMLPLRVTLEDYNNTEKIAYLDNKLNTNDSPDGYTPQIGDFAYYVPWGNLSIFYKEFRYSNSLVKLGEIESGIEIIENLNENVEIYIEREY